MLLVERHGLRRNGKGTQLPAPEHRKPRADLNLHAGSDRVGGAAFAWARISIHPRLPPGAIGTRFFLCLTGTRLSAAAAASELPPSLPLRAV
jgi:hypothetical protein